MSTKSVPCIFERLFPGQRCAKHYKKTRTVKSRSKTKKVA